VIGKKLNNMNIGVYPGSFNPFHKGHLNILQKAEKIFDSVIILRGVNLEKSNERLPLPKSIQDREIIEYNGLLTDSVYGLYEHFGSMPTIIRGLRNSIDLQYEMNQYRYLQELMPEIQMVSIFCDKEFEHISSSGIRTLSNYGSDIVKNYLVD
jgi:pantetheine-phosphate adenylyltransferase